MFIRSLTLAALSLVVSSPLLAADIDSPLAQDYGKNRALIVIAPSTADPTLVGLKKALDDPANQKAFDERQLVLYEVAQTVGKRANKYMEQPTTMALIRGLKLGVTPEGKSTVILVGKDGQQKTLEHDGPMPLKDVFSAVDALPAAEKETVAPTPPPPPAAAEAKPAKGAKPGKAEKPGKAPAPPKALDD
ncbi:DUF4174 domain-containing protein [Pseudomonas gingeri]|uniref:DUF4174 domain-containing protein n=1 Tax=Pseudomonas gingeri TaxID=117681 RepID=UPI0015A105C4|nr:DUF4174 domain-containing protein [Pseudomonas gingeri]NWA02383.1 DUF4174 domain-containing protein [Pseudomonas gingeri]NWA12444.1 DUF4174 domain-containing protein [Pseudomonas gingeri]NWA57150.1 DUF4174 domain-containing protein [Pseudomonas gingeri]NWA93493.1 DUF4174 domain-containing protein [Pseudomonas gingeri]NWB02965.1 DUF4174 domain-containing protein [Pseudomonas gingeri]